MYGNKSKLLLVVIILISAIIIVLNIYFSEGIDGFSDKINPVEFDTLATNMGGESGFYSQILCNIRHWLYAKKHGLNFKMTTNNWHYTLDKGWEDYFENLDSNRGRPTNKIMRPGIFDILEKYPIKDYVDVIPQFYRPNSKMLTAIKSKKEELGLVDGVQYGAIYIRRGDKLINEIELVHSSEFLKKLLEIYPACDTVFLQTDDYTCFQELEKYIKENNLQIRLLTLCPNTSFGAISNGYWMDRLNENIKNNPDSYLQNVKEKLSKSVAEMTAEEKMAHTLELMASVEICCNAQYVVCDYRSNVARFIKCAHKIDVFRVFDVNDSDKIFSLENKSCPCFSFNLK
jgi:hypothetical protein